MATNAIYTVTLEIHRLSKDGKHLDEQAPKVCYKRDGQRFPTSQWTMKFLVDTFYEFQIQVRPPLPLHSVSIQATPVTIFEAQAGGNAGYTFKWDTIKMEADKKKKRTTLSIMLEFQGNLNVNIPLQCKFYKLQDEDHLTWGNVLHHINYECAHKPGQTEMEIVKEHFF